LRDGPWDAQVLEIRDLAFSVLVVVFEVTWNWRAAACLGTYADDDDEDKDDMSREEDEEER
jgi:hypothetical protein